MRLTIYTTSTTGFERAIETQARRVCAALAIEKRIKQEDIKIVLVTDNEKAMKDGAETYRKCLPAANVVVIADKRLQSQHQYYKINAQLLIAQMRTIGTKEALAWDSDLCLSLDGDVLPPYNAIRCMIDMLQFDGGYYGVSFCPYPSHGGGAFLGGRGTHRNPILPDSYEDEKEIPAELTDKRAELEKILEESQKKPDFDPKPYLQQLHEVNKKIRDIPAQKNVFELNSKSWRQRGWFDMAYPAIGKGAVVPVDWTGFGCTMMNREALALCDWAGYDGRGTEDLFVNFQRWEANGIKMCCIPHCPCDHVVRNPETSDGAEPFVHVHAGHERDGEYVGHLRQWRGRWFTHLPGEKDLQIKEENKL
jgi:hypothetical protein